MYSLGKLEPLFKKKNPSHRSEWDFVFLQKFLKTVFRIDYPKAALLNPVITRSLSKDFT